MTTSLSIMLNARLQPVHRGEWYEDPLLEILADRMPGSEISGGGTFFDPGTGPLSCDITLDLEGDAREGMALVIEILEDLGAPKESKATLDEGEPVPFGRNDGLGLYLNGTELPPEVYEANDVNELIQLLLDRLGDEGAMQSWWHGAEETALYLYGPSADRMRELIGPVLDSHPLAARSRLVPIT